MGCEKDPTRLLERECTHDDDRILQTRGALDSVMSIDPRERHYGGFYGVDPVEADDDRPLLVVWGNCQAEALRIVLDSAPQFPYRSVRVPPVHELTAADVPLVEALFQRASVVVTQPIRPGYRGLPIGTADVTAMAPTAKRIVWPVIRYGGLFPFQVIVRHPSNPSAVPAGVPYHDLRTVIASKAGRTTSDGWDRDVTPDRLLAAAQWSIAQLHSREQRDCDVAVSDVLLGLGADAAHTINHPANPVLSALGDRILGELEAGSPIMPDRELLGGIRAPLEQRVIDALGIDAQPRADWTVNGVSIDDMAIRIAQMRWYDNHPEFLDAAIDRYEELLDILGLSV